MTDTKLKAISVGHSRIYSSKARHRQGSSLREDNAAVQWRASILHTLNLDKGQGPNKIK